jgi:UDP-N-acetylglucosamine acyltransferase
LKISVHPSAVVSPDAFLEDGVEIGPFSIIGRDVRIGKNTTIASHVVIAEHTHIGENCKIAQFSSIGGIPQDLKFKGEITRVKIGNYNDIREFVTINRATKEDIGSTIIGNHNLIMAYSHIAHNCQLKNHIVLANATNLAGHILVEDFAVLGGLTGVHQFTKIGAHSMIGGMSAVNMDIPPFVTASGNRVKLYGLNIIGMKRRRFNEEIIEALKQAYRIIFRSNLTISLAIDRANNEVYQFPEVKHFLNFIQSSQRGVCR